MHPNRWLVLGYEDFHRVRDMGAVASILVQVTKPNIILLREIHALVLFEMLARQIKVGF